MKRLISLLIFAFMITFSSQLVFAYAFSDVEGKDCEVAINFLTEKGIVTGYSDGTFYPNTPVTRAELCKLIVVTNDLKEINSSVNNPTDILSHWAKEFIVIGLQHQIVKGYPDGTFKPQKNITYAELMTVLIGALNKQDQLNPEVSWPNNYIDLAKSLGLECGISINNWRSYATRGDVSIAIYNLMQLNNVEVSLINAGAKTYRTDENNNIIYATEFNKDGNDKVQIELNLEYSSLVEDVNVSLTSKLIEGSEIFKSVNHSILLKKGSSESIAYIELSLVGMSILNDTDYTIEIYSNQTEIASCTFKITANNLY